MLDEATIERFVREEYAQVVKAVAFTVHLGARNSTIHPESHPPEERDRVLIPTPMEVAYTALAIVMTLGASPSSR